MPSLLPGLLRVNLIKQVIILPVVVNTKVCIATFILFCSFLSNDNDTYLLNSMNC